MASTILDLAPASQSLVDLEIVPLLEHAKRLDPLAARPIVSLDVSCFRNRMFGSCRSAS